MLYQFLVYSVPAFLIGGVFGAVITLIIPRDHRLVLRANINRILIGVLVTGFWAASNFLSLQNGTQVSWWLNAFMGIVLMFCFTTPSFKPSDLIDKFTNKK